MNDLDTNNLSSMECTFLGAIYFLNFKYVIIGHYNHQLSACGECCLQACSPSQVIQSSSPPGLMSQRAQRLHPSPRPRGRCHWARVLLLRLLRLGKDITCASSGTHGTAFSRQGDRPRQARGCWDGRGEGGREGIYFVWGMSSFLN